MQEATSVHRRLHRVKCFTILATNMKDAAVCCFDVIKRSCVGRHG
jgi:hypothetical protein